MHDPLPDPPPNVEGELMRNNPPANTVHLPGLSGCLNSVAKSSHGSPLGQVKENGLPPWQVVDGHGTLRFVCDERAMVFRGDGGDLFQIEENNVHNMKGQLLEGALGGLLGGLFGSRSSADEARESEGRVAAPAQAWTIREEGALIIAKAVNAGAGGVDIEPLPSGWINDKVVARRATPDLAAYIRRLGPVHHRVTEGGRDKGRGELRGPAGHVIAVDQFTCVPVRKSGYTHHDVTQWSFQIFNNPFPASWVFAMLRSTKSI